MSSLDRFEIRFRSPEDMVSETNELPTPDPPEQNESTQQTDIGAATEDERSIWPQRTPLPVAGDADWFRRRFPFCFHRNRGRNGDRTEEDWRHCKVLREDAWSQILPCPKCGLRMRKWHPIGLRTLSREKQCPECSHYYPGSLMIDARFFRDPVCVCACECPWSENLTDENYVPPSDESEDVRCTSSTKYKLDIDERLARSYRGTEVLGVYEIEPGKWRALYQEGQGHFEMGQTVNDDPAPLGHVDQDGLRVLRRQYTESSRPHPQNMITQTEVMNLTRGADVFEVEAAHSVTGKSYKELALIFPEVAEFLPRFEPPLLRDVRPRCNFCHLLLAPEMIERWRSLEVCHVCERFQKPYNLADDPMYGDFRPNLYPMSEYCYCRCECADGVMRNPVDRHGNLLPIILDDSDDEDIDISPPNTGLRFGFAGRRHRFLRYGMNYVSEDDFGAESETETSSGDSSDEDNNADVEMELNSHSTDDSSDETSSERRQSYERTRPNADPFLLTCWYYFMEPIQVSNDRAAAWSRMVDLAQQNPLILRQFEYAGLDLSSWHSLVAEFGWRGSGW